MEQEQPQYFRSYDLTPLTRGAAAERRVVASGFEFRLPLLLFGGLGLLASLPFVFLLWPLMHFYTLILVMSFPALSVWLFLGNSTRGMQTSNWRHYKNKVVNNSGKFFIAGEPFDPDPSEIGLIVRASIPVDATQDEPDLVQIPSSRAGKKETATW